MKKVKAMFFITISIFMLNILLTPQIGQSIFVNYPYSVKIGDKIDYHLDILTNGTETGTYNVFGLNMTQGDNFQLEIFDAIASNSSTSPIGGGYTLRIDKGDAHSNTFPGDLFIYTNNATYWTKQGNYSFNWFGTIVEYTGTSNNGEFSSTTNADNFAIWKFDQSTGYLTSYEAKTSDTTGNYTHIKMTKGSSGISIPGIGNVPGFELSASFLALLSISTLIVIRKKRQF